MKKLNKHEANLIKEIICENNAVFEMDDKLYNVSMVSAAMTKVPDCVNPEKQQKFEKAKRNILRGEKCSIDEVVEMMDCGAL